MPPQRRLMTWVTAPLSLLDESTRGWETALALGRRHRVSGRWYPALAEADALGRVPDAVRRHLQSDYIVAADRVRIVRWEINRIAHALRDTDIDFTLLKGAAYIAAGLVAGNCRRVSDVDILVARDRLAEVERALAAHGWQAMPHDEYDDRYYRDWMHELPPLVHTLRATSLDVHHNILPLTSDLCPDAAELLARAVPLPGLPCRTLSPTDMVMHSVLHGFYGGEFTNCFRDVLDVFELCQDFARQDGGFWEALVARARAMRAARPLWLALRLVSRSTPLEVPPTVFASLAAASGTWPARSVVEALIDAVFEPSLPPARTERLALQALLVRSHWVKMPIRILAPHLARKMFLSAKQRLERADSEQR